MSDDIAATILERIDGLTREVSTLRAVINRGRVKYTVQQAGDRLGVSSRTIERRITDGRLASVQEGGRRFVTEAACADYEDAERE